MTFSSSALPSASSTLSSLSGSGSGSGSGSSYSSSGSSSYHSSEDGEDEQEEEESHHCDGSFRCIGSPVTKIVKSFAEYEKSNSLGGSDFNSPAQSLFSKHPRQLSISEVGKVADKAACQAIRRRLEAEADLEDLKRTIKRWNAVATPSNYRLNPKCQLNNFCRLNCQETPDSARVSKFGNNNNNEEQHEGEGEGEGEEQHE